MNDEYSLIQLDESDIILEALELKKEVSILTDQRLVEVVNELLLQLEFSKESEYHIGRFFTTSKLCERGRDMLEGAYVLYYSTMALGVDNGDILLTNLK